MFVFSPHQKTELWHISWEFDPRLSLSPLRIHLSTCMKRMKTLFREDSVKRYKELLANCSTWSRSVGRRPALAQSVSVSATFITLPSLYIGLCQKACFRQILC